MVEVRHYWPDGGMGVGRVVDAMRRHLPDREMLVLHVNGRLDRAHRVVEQNDLPYVVVQYALRSTQRPKCDDWIALWREAELVWSYYDLPALCAEDDVEPEFAFYRSPLGIADTFRQPTRRRRKAYTVLTHGDYLTQGTREALLAAGGGAHLGPRFERAISNRVDFYNDLPDSELADLYGRCKYVAPLRRHDGFELPAAEALAQGCRPILFDREHYRHWFEDHAVYVQEAPRPEVEEQLREVFSRRYQPPTRAEQSWAQKRFDWEPIMEGLRAHL